MRRLKENIGSRIQLGIEQFLKASTSGEGDTEAGTMASPRVEVNRTNNKPKSLGACSKLGLAITSRPAPGTPSREERKKGRGRGKDRKEPGPVKVQPLERWLSPRVSGTVRTRAETVGEANGRRTLDLHG